MRLDALRGLRSLPVARRVKQNFILESILFLHLEKGNYESNGGNSISILIIRKTYFRLAEIMNPKSSCGYELRLDNLSKNLINKWVSIFPRGGGKREGILTLL